MPVTSHAEANGAMNDFFYAVRHDLDERLEKLLNDAKNVPVPPEAYSTFVEAVFANMGEFTIAQLEPVADVAQFAGELNFITLRDGRGERIAQLLRGNEVTGIVEPDPRYAPPPEVPPMTPPVPGEE